MYLFQHYRPFGRPFKGLIYIPLCIYFNQGKPPQHVTPYRFTFHYVSISTSNAKPTGTCSYIFTFHYVSISTPAIITGATDLIKFTFHYVSISTIPSVYYIPPGYIFTFHYVSISTITVWILILVMQIYIPLCIYLNKLQNQKESN